MTAVAASSNVSLPLKEWGLLNAICWSPTRSGVASLSRFGYDEEPLLALQRRGFVRLTWRADSGHPEGEPAEVTAGNAWDLLARDALSAELTQAGLEWLSKNPQHQVLLAVAPPGPQRPLARIARARNLPLPAAVEAVSALADRGLVVVEGRGRDPQYWDVLPTAAGKRILGY